MLLLPLASLLLLVAVFSLARLGQRYLQRLQRGEQGPDREHPRWLPLLRKARNDPPDTEARVFRLAYKRRGRIMVSDAVIDLGLSIQQAEELLNSLVDGLRVRMEVTPNGLVVYEFPEILSRFQRA